MVGKRCGRPQVPTVVRAALERPSLSTVTVELGLSKAGLSVYLPQLSLSYLGSLTMAARHTASQRPIWNLFPWKGGLLLTTKKRATWLMPPVPAESGQCSMES